MKPVGYLIFKDHLMNGERGQYYDYTLAGNGLFIVARNPVIGVRIPVALAEVRGLDKLPTEILLLNGKIPSHLLHLVADMMLINLDREMYAGIVWKDGYHIYIPEQKGEPGSVTFAEGDNVVVDIHSHGTMPPRFSSIDDADEKGLRIYIVIGNLGGQVGALARVGVYGYHYYVPLFEIFHGEILGIEDYYALGANE